MTFSICLDLIINIPEKKRFLVQTSLKPVFVCKRQEDRFCVQTVNKPVFWSKHEKVIFFFRLRKAVHSRIIFRGFVKWQIYTSSVTECKNCIFLNLHAKHFFLNVWAKTHLFCCLKTIKAFSPFPLKNLRTSLFKKCEESGFVFKRQ